jgi:hypothetical protein
MDIPKIVLWIVILIVSAALILYISRGFLIDLLFGEASPISGYVEEGLGLAKELTGELVKNFK